MIEGRKFQLRNVLFCFLLVCYLGKVCKMTRRRNECVVIPLKDKEALLRSLFQINSFCFQDQNELLWDVDVLKVFIFNYIVDARIDRRLAGAAGHTQIDVESNLAGEARPPPPGDWRDAQHWSHRHTRHQSQGSSRPHNLPQSLLSPLQTSDTSPRTVTPYWHTEFVGIFSYEKKNILHEMWKKPD